MQIFAHLFIVFDLHLDVKRFNCCLNMVKLHWNTLLSVNNIECLSQYIWIVSTKNTFRYLRSFE